MRHSEPGYSFVEGKKYIGHGENLEDVFIRAKKALLKYSNYKKIIVVIHGIVIRRFSYEPNIPFME